MPESNKDPQLTYLAENNLLSWLKLKYSSGLNIIKKERAYDQCSRAIKYINGDHGTVKNKALSNVSTNRLRKLALETVATMTDVRPIWNYETYVKEYEKQGDVLNKLARAWWRDTYADRRLASILLYSCAGGSGYGLLTWNRELNDGKGNLEFVPFDPRDVIPIDPTYGDNIQDWRGIILRQRFPLETVKQMFPSKASQLFGKTSSWGPPRSEMQGKADAIVSPLWGVTDSKMGGTEVPGTDIMRAYFKDDSLNLTDAPIEMGQGDWAYTVYPMGGNDEKGNPVTKEMARLYPRGRLVIFTPETILKDMPNPHWHGMFPVIRFTLDPMPWSILGSSMIGDLIPLQDTLNQALRGAEDGLRQWVQRNVAADLRAMPRSALDALDTRMAGLKFHYNAQAPEPFKVIDGPDAGVFNLYNQLIENLKMEIEDVSGMRGVATLAQMGQMPSADTMEKYMEALSPILRLRSRSMEISLSQLAHMLKVGFFQWYAAPRRIELLGQDGVSREDFDFEPATMVPTGEGHIADRAMKHQKLFSFQVAPNSWLNVSHTTQKMFMLQLLREGLMDPWTVWDQFDVPDAGLPPAETVPERITYAKKQGLMQGATPELMQLQLATQMAQLQAQLAQLQQPQQQGPGGAAPPESAPGGPPKAPGGPGRPPTGQVPPHFETRDGGMRPIVSESP